ncbi:protein BASIC PENTACYSTEINE2-like [Olea europaea var. sylvestris]|uniref:protein BASIC PENTACYSTEINE2-like n=1 Tax=Olea europaea var. sylvestris TaxID=158386 RepID=UPI000C1D6028|nr:protein BASIC PENTACYSTEINE2-like [Olea europaea var. sylvestris]
MDGNGSMNLRNWGFLERATTPLKSHLGLQLMSSMAEKPVFSGDVHAHHRVLPSGVMASINGGPFHHHRVGGISESHIPMDCTRENWMNHGREKYVNSLPGNQNQGYYHLNYGLLPEASSAHSIQMPQQINIAKNENAVRQVEEVRKEGENGGSGGALNKKRGGGKVPKSPAKEKKPRTRAPRDPREESSPSVQRARAPKKRAEVMINGINMDISGIPIPVCSCTGTPQQCYRWGSGGWQSACCTTGMSVYPLPMSTKRRGARIAGRKMSIGAFKKVLEKFASEGYNFSNPIDLKSYWAKHGTNKFVTIR